MPVPKSRRSEKSKGFDFSREDKAVFAEIREFEARVGHVWTLYAEQGESWASYCRRGCPLEEAPILAPKPVLEAVEGVKTAPTPLPPKREARKPQTPKENVPAERIANDYDVDVVRIPSGRYLIYGEAVSTTMRWLGSRGLGSEECVLLVKNLALKDGGGVASDNHKSFVGAGAKGFRVPNFNEDQVGKLLLAVGKGATPAPKAKSRKGK